MIEADRVVVASGAPEPVMTPSNSGKGQKITRCPTCRIALWSNYAGAGDKVHFVRVGTLDDPDRFPPDIHIFTMSKQPWVVIPPGVHAVPEYYDRNNIGRRPASSGDGCCSADRKKNAASGRASRRLDNDRRRTRYIRGSPFSLTVIVGPGGRAHLHVMDLTTE
jgi:hypothetical protein